jgi:hypothetical protein
LTPQTDELPTIANDDSPDVIRKDVPMISAISARQSTDESGVAEKVRTLAAVKPALVRLLEWQIDQELERSEQDERRQ